MVTIQDAVDNTVIIDVNDPIDLTILGIDPDNDSIFLDLLNDENNPLPPGVSFVGATGIGNVNSQFIWTPTCDDVALNNGGVFNFQFLVGDDNCVDMALDTVNLEVIVEDGLFTFDAVDPKNVFTPLNGDDFNPVFFVEDLPPR